MHSKQWHYSLHRDFQNCYSTRRSLTRFFKLQFQLQFYTCTLHYTTLQSREFSIQNTILHAEDKELFEYYYYIQRAKRPSLQKRNSTHRRQGDLLEMHPCVLQDIPVIHDLPAFPGNSTILHYSSISRESTPSQHSQIRMHILQFDWFPEKLHRVPVEQFYKLYKHYILQRKGDVAISVKLTYSPE